MVSTLFFFFLSFLLFIIVVCLLVVSHSFYTCTSLFFFFFVLFSFKFTFSVHLSLFSPKFYLCVIFYVFREKSIAKKYWDKMYKEYAICDLSRYKENKVWYNAIMLQLPPISLYLLFKRL